MDDREDVVGTGLRECPERRSVGRRRLGRAPRVERVADVAEGRQVAQQSFAGRGRNVRQVDPGPRCKVRDQRGFPGRDRDDACPAATDAAAHPPAAGHQLGRLQELVQVGAAEDSCRREGCIRRPVLTRKGPRVGERSRLGLGASADLHDHDRLAKGQGPVREGEEPLRPLEPLEEEDDRRRLRVVEAVAEEVAGIEDDLAAAADDPREADPRAGLDEGIGHRSGLGDAGDPAPRQPRVDVTDVGRGVRRQVEHAHAVRPEERRAVTDRDLADLALHAGRRLAALDDAAARDNDGWDAGQCRLLDDGGRSQRVEGDEDGVRSFGQGVEGWIARLAEQLVVARVDEVTTGLAAHHDEVVANGPGDTATVRGADHGDRSRCEQWPQVDRSRQGCRSRDGRSRAGVHPTTALTPRRSSARATISRWISEVPSQIRSTRSSRK